MSRKRSRKERRRELRDLDFNIKARGADEEFTGFEGLLMPKRRKRKHKGTKLGELLAQHRKNQELEEAIKANIMYSGLIRTRDDSLLPIPEGMEPPKHPEGWLPYGIDPKNLSEEELAYLERRKQAGAAKRMREEGFEDLRGAF